MTLTILVGVASALVRSTLGNGTSVGSTLGWNFTTHVVNVKVGLGRTVIPWWTSSLVSPLLGFSFDVARILRSGLLSNLLFLVGRLVALTSAAVPSLSFLLLSVSLWLRLCVLLTILVRILLLSIRFDSSLSTSLRLLISSWGSETLFGLLGHLYSRLFRSLLLDILAFSLSPSFSFYQQHVRSKQNALTSAVVWLGESLGLGFLVADFLLIERLEREHDLDSRGRSVGLLWVGVLNDQKGVDLVHIAKSVTDQ